MFISGSIGVTILKKNNKNIIILADDHSNSSYCDNDHKNHKSIKEYLEKELNDGDQILLEEVPRDGFNLQELWPESPHTQELKEYFLSEDKIDGIDIRPYIIPFSYDLLESDKKLENYPMKEYINLIDEFFNLKGKFYNKIIFKNIKNLQIKNSGLGKNFKFLFDKFKKLQEKINNENYTIGYYFKNDIKFLEEINRLIDEIMEFNTLLSAFTTNKKSIIHAGLYHSHNMIKWLINEYGFQIIYKNGINNFNNDIYTKTYNSCIFLPGIEMFGFKD